jgi:GNAT superfamily N-acetyltransferase
MTDIAITVAPATAADAALLAGLGARTFFDTYAADNTEADMATYLAECFSPAQQALELADERSLFLIARADGAPVGYTRLRLGEAPDCVAGCNPVELVRFYADLPWIGRGVGPALMEAALGVAGAMGCDVVWLDVWTRNPRGLAFYTKWGFTVAGRQTFLLGEDVQDDLIMSRAVRGVGFDNPGPSAHNRTHM